MIELKNISKTYTMGSTDVHALQNISITIEQGDYVAIMGPSGSGKSTLMHVLGCLDKPDSGSYKIFGKEMTLFSQDELAVLRNRIAGFVFQQFFLLPRISALENVELPLMYAGKRHLKENALKKIEEVGLLDRAKHRPNELSGGQQQRVAIARALVNDPIIIFADEPTGNLDTKSEIEIMNVFKKLNESGKTVIMVTHEKDVAVNAKRIISMRDGYIISDERISKITAVQEHSKDKHKKIIIADENGKIKGAEIKDHFKQAFHSIFSHKMRTALSMLGILIGVGAVIAMLALGQGAKVAMEKTLSSLGSNLLVIRPGSHRMRGVSMESGTVTRFTLEDADAIANIKSVVKSVSGNVQGRGQVTFGNKNWNTTISGTGTDYASMHAATPVFGRYFNKEEIKTRKRVAVIGQTIARELFEHIDPVGKTIKINRISFYVVGILPEKGSGGFGGRDQDDVIVIPVTTAMYRLLGKIYVDNIEAEIKDSTLMDKAETEIRDLVTKRHKIREKADEENSSFEIRNMAEIQEAVAKTSRTMTVLLGSIALISLLVGGIGIMNIMLVSVTERTREIGLRKAIGARKSDIIIQFLIEAVVMTFIGGLLGILFGSGAAMLLTAIAKWSIYISKSSIIIATTFSIAVGIIFGIWPARKASQLDPIEALRYE
ncbi:MAG: ABC transporter permease [Elusimicrobiota bacterium]